MENLENKNEITIFTGVNKKVYCSVKTESEESKKNLFNALENCDVLLNDCVGTEIELKDIYIEERETTDEKTGEIKTKFRTILFDENGQSYVTTAYGIYNILKKIVQVYGTPDTWKNPIKVKVIKPSIKNGKTTLSLSLI